MENENNKDVKIEEMAPKFRESAYTPLKKFFDTKSPADFDNMKREVDLAAEDAIAKKKMVIEKYLKS